MNSGVQGAELGGLYTRIVLRDVLPRYPGRGAFRPGRSEFGGTKAWTGSPMAALQRAVLMMDRLNILGIPAEIRDGLRELQDIYSREVDLEGSDGSDTRDARDVEDAEILLHEPSTGKEAPNRSRETELEDASRGFNDGRMNILIERRGHDSDNVDALQTKENGAERTPEVTDGSRSWKWGPGATSQDAVTFFRRVL
jgi:hypothetical protein